MFDWLYVKEWGEGNLIFCCTSPTDTNFLQIKIVIRMTSHINISSFYYWYFFYDIFLLDYNQINKTQKINAFNIFKSCSKDM